MLLENDSSKFRTYAYAAFGLMLVFAMSLAVVRPAASQDPAGPAADVPDTENAAADGGVDEPAAPAPSQEIEGINVFALMIQGGAFMIPIFLMSMLTATFTIERFLGLRKSKVLPDELIEDLGKLSSPQAGFDPRKAYKICQQYPSAAATVIRAMLLKVGRPHSEVEHTVAEASEREAERMYANVRWLNLASAVTPLMGLLGTVWGMIRAFHDTTQLAPGQNKADYLAEGIYVALVTTLGGLSVAIPSAIFSHYFEGRVTTLFHQIDELLFNLMPQVERYEGRVRFSKGMGEHMSDAGEGGEKATPPPVEAAATQ